MKYPDTIAYQKTNNFVIGFVCLFFFFKFEATDKNYIEQNYLYSRLHLSYIGTSGIFEEKL